MNRTIIININSIVFHIEEDAYEILRSYMIEIKKHFGKTEDSKEILEDIENRIAEMFAEKIQSGRKEVINVQDVNEVISQMGRVSDFEADFLEEVREESEPAIAAETEAESIPEVEGEPEAAKPEETINEPAFAFAASKKLMRDMDDRIFGGVCSGLGHYFNLESKWIRIMFVLFFLFAGSGVLLYVVLWAVMPKAITRADKMAMRGEAANLQNFKKSFDEEMKGLGENFSGAGEHFNRGVRTVGDLFGRVLSAFGKFLAIIFLIAFGCAIIGLFVTFVFCTLNLLGIKNDIMLPPLTVMTPVSAFFALLAGFMAIGIPFFAIFYLLLRVVFKVQRMNNYLSMTLFATWIISVVMILYFVVITQQEFKEVSTISVEKPLDKSDSYIFTEHDVRVIKASDEEFNKKKFNINVKGENLADYLRRDISIRVEAIDSLKAPYIQYNYRAKGNTYKEASDRASRISYQVKQDKNVVSFDSHFAMNQQDKVRDQHVGIIVYLPVGTKVSLTNSIGHRIQDISAWECNQYNENAKSSEWIMTANGLRCILKMQDDKLKAEKEAIEKAEEEAKQKEEEAKEKAKELEELKEKSEKKEEAAATKA
ncbi:PspC domain-containing protein [Sphingobacterium sp. DK4209]|uniref:PspC domain-containing protein n=1 Tax=Sphingobacterium zhuxiongii TaxID=2662364 RepID=A0A5Q0Q7B7_9SPHI|nr:MULTISPECIES: PspC domain-containing protein [unclassified Sphingobacterium]MVZ66275.1 PspC domain-containing protein [Sphingobacterium sp. DK4209]QGA24999.1 PspC domain-containing protein [Sphingobacterium sp. dk4302]